jgi:hypothetical protein
MLSTKEVEKNFFYRIVKRRKRSLGGVAEYAVKIVEFSIWVKLPAYSGRPLRQFDVQYRYWHQTHLQIFLKLTTNTTS